MKKLLKYVIILLVLLALIAVALMAFSPKKLIISESTSIDAPPTMIYNMVNDLSKWETWSPWYEMDPVAKHTITDKKSGVGAQWDWDGEKLGKGYQKIIENTASEKVRLQLEFDGGKGISYSNWTLVPDGPTKTKVEWDFDGAETNFIFRPFNLFMKSGLQKTFKDGLVNLKRITEERAKNKVYNGYKVTETTVGERHYIMNRSEVDIAMVQQFYTQNLSNLFMKTQGAQMEMAGMPSGLFFSWDESKGKTDMAAAIPLKEPIAVQGTATQTIKGGRAVQVDYYGDYDKTEVAHLAIEEYINDHGLLINYPIVQEYMTDPNDEKDPDKWLTKITYYLAETN